MINYSENAKKIYERLYLRKDPVTGETIETIEECHKRIAKHLANSQEEFKVFKEALDTQAIRLNTPAMMHAGLNHGKSLLACYVVGLEDDMASIIDMWATCARIYEHGGGAGIPIYKLREKNSPISRGGYASGPISYMKVIQAISEQVKSGGTTRRAANLVALRYDHPDILDFIEIKKHENLSAMNLSVLVDDAFMKALDTNDLIVFKSPNKNFADKITRERTCVTAWTLWEKICTTAWETGDPGLLFKDTMEMNNPLPSTGQYVCCNPCLAKGTWLLDGNRIRKIEDGGSNWHSWKTGNKRVIKLITNAGYEIVVTPDHRIMLEDGSFIEAENAVEKALAWEVGNLTKNTNIERYIVVGFLFGDGFLCGCKHGVSVKLNVNKEREVADLLLKYGFYSQGEDEGNTVLYCNKKKLEDMLGISLDFLNRRVYERDIPDDVIFGDADVVGSFLMGLFEANGSVSRIGQISLKTTNLNTAKGVQKLLSAFGIKSWIVKNIGREIRFKNGTYRCRDSYNLQISPSNSIIFREKIGFYSERKNSRIRKPKYFRKQKLIVTEIVDAGVAEVYDFKMKNGNPYNWANGIVAHNCGEVVGKEWTCCCLGHINLVKCLKDGKFDENIFKKYIKIGVYMLNRVLEKTPYPHPKFKERMLKERPIGLGIMGLADVFYLLKIPYDSGEAKRFFRNICMTLTKTAFECSYKYAMENKVFIEVPKEDEEHFVKYIDRYTQGALATTQVANSTVTCIAPTGSTALSADCSYSFEPKFALVWSKRLVDSNEELIFVDEIFKAECERRGIKLTQNLLEKIASNKGSIRGLSEFPEDMQRIFVVAHDINPFDRLEMQAAGQEYITQAISSTVNLPNSATVEDVDMIFRRAWELCLKGITVYRDGCKADQPVVFGGKQQTITVNQPRPQIRSGKTVEIETPRGKLYITGNEYDNALKEVFLNMGRQSTMENAFFNAIGRLISKMLQHGISIDVIVDTLRGSGGDPFWFKLEDRSYQAQGFIDLIALVIDKVFRNKDIHQDANGTVCPQCGCKTLVISSGCRGGMCINPDCGYSACA